VIFVNDCTLSRTVEFPIKDYARKCSREDAFGNQDYWSVSENGQIEKHVETAGCVVRASGAGNLHKD
jgi:hypothetical protein